MNRALLVIAIGFATVLALLVTVGLLSEDERGLRAVGKPAAEACQEMTDVQPSGANEHVEGTVSYTRVPPSSGRHATSPARIVKRRYLVNDAPPVEQVVHNLEHGWVVVWYDPNAADLVTLDEALDKADERKLVAVPYTRGSLPTPYVLTAWGHEQRCTAASGPALADFLAAHGGPNNDAPESNAPN